MRTPTSTRTRLPHLIAAAACVSMAWGLAACGSATVEDSGTGNEQTGTATSVAPLERGSHSSEAKSSTEKSHAESASATNSQSAKSPDRESPSGDASEPVSEGDAGEQGAREVDKVPEPDASVSREDQRYLDYLQEKKIDTKGVEAQVTGAAGSVCQGDSVTLPAVAGQLIEQGRTDMKHEELVRVMSDQAKDAYC